MSVRSDSVRADFIRHFPDHSRDLVSVPPLANLNAHCRNHEAPATMGRQAGRSVRRPDWLELYQGGSCLGMLADVLADPHRAELGAAHTTEGRGLEGVLGQRFVVHPAGGLGIEGETELVFPVEAVPRSAEGVVAVASPCPVIL